MYRRRSGLDSDGGRATDMPPAARAAARAATRANRPLVRWQERTAPEGRIERSIAFRSSADERLWTRENGASQDSTMPPNK